MLPAELRQMLIDCASKHESTQTNNNTALSAAIAVPHTESDIKSAVNSAIQLTAIEALHTISNLSLTQKVQGLVVVCGTAFIMSDARAALGVVEDRDADELFFTAPANIASTAAIAGADDVQVNKK